MVELFAASEVVVVVTTVVATVDGDDSCGTDLTEGVAVDVVKVVEVVGGTPEPIVVPVAFRVDADAFGVVVFGEDVGPSGDVQPVGGVSDPVCPGMRTVPAHPKLEKVACRVTELPSVNVSVDLTWRMYPALSMDTMTEFDV